MDASEIIDAFGGNQAVAADLNIGRNAISMWRSNGIPKTRCVELARLAKAKGLRRITLLVLMQSTPRELSVNQPSKVAPA